MKYAKPEPKHMTFPHSSKSGSSETEDQISVEDLQALVEFSADRETEVAESPTAVEEPRVRSSSPSANGSPPKARRMRPWMIVVPALLAVGAGAVALTPQIRSQLMGDSPANPNLVTEAAKRGRFLVSVTERGTLDSIKSTTLHNTVEGSTTIISIVPEGTQVKGPVVSDISGTVADVAQASADGTAVVSVRNEPVLFNNPLFFLYLDAVTVEHPVQMGQYTKAVVKPGEEVRRGQILAGDVVCELDSAALEDQLREQLNTIITAEGALKKAQQNVEIQVKTNESEIAAALLARDLAQLDLEKYNKGEARQEELTIRGKIKVAEQQLAQKQEQYEFVGETVKLGFENLQKLEAARIAVVQAMIELQNAQGELNLHTYTKKRTLKERDALAIETERALKRAEMTAQMTLLFFRAEHEAALGTYEYQKTKYDRLRQQVAACKLVAPQDGKVIYASEQRRRSEPEIIEAGTQVRERQAIIKLPDFSRMKVDVKIHESKIAHLREGLKARIRVDAVRDRLLLGVVESVPDVPVRGDWPNTDMMLYDVDVLITSDPSDLKPGMNAEVEIVSQERDDVLQVPIQSIVGIGDEYHAWVVTDRGPERREIQIGSSNNKMVEILAGIDDGAEVVMNPKTHFGDEIAELQGATDSHPADDEDQPAGSDEAAPDTSLAVKPPGGPAGPPKGKAPKARTGAKKAGGDPAAFFKTMDTNGDGTLTKAELPERLQSRFDQFDADGDGSVDPGEFQKAMSAARKGRTGRPSAGGPDLGGPRE